MTDAGPIDNFPGNSASFKFKQKITGTTENDGIKDAKIMVPLKYLSGFWRTLETPLINCEINLVLTWSTNCVISNTAANQETAFAVTDKKLHVPVVSYSKLLQQLKSGLKRTITWNKYQSKTTIQNAPNRNLDYLIDPSFHGVNRLLF